MDVDGPLPAPGEPEGLSRLETGVPGFDRITCGGFLQTGVYILQGMPGAGKTILANQIAYHHAAQGGQVVYVTMLAESHARLLQHLSAFDFFRPEMLPKQIYYVSAFDALRTQGLKGVVELLRNEMKSRQAGVLILDGLVMAASAARSDEELKIFVSDIQAHSVLTGCTTLLLTSEDADRPVSAEQTMVDGIVLMREVAYGVRRERKIEVLKFRGSETLRGTHTFTIGRRGITIYPRIEAARRAGPDAGVKAEPLSTGVPGLDAMLHLGGYARGSMNVLCGPSGCGKTTLSLHFLAATAPDERSLFVGFYESPELLETIARLDGISDDIARSGGGVEFMWQPFGENVLDEIADRVLQAVEKMRPARLVIDGLGGLYATPSFAERGGSFLASFTNELRRLGATTLVTVEEKQPGGGEPMDTATMSALADTQIGCRVTHEDAVRRFVWIGKSRVSRADTRVLETRLGDRGIEIVDWGKER